MRSGGEQGHRQARSQRARGTAAGQDHVGTAKAPGTTRPRAAPAGSRAQHTANDSGTTRPSGSRASRISQARQHGEAGRSKTAQAAPADNEPNAANVQAAALTQPVLTAAQASPEALTEPKPRRKPPLLSKNIAQGRAKKADDAGSEVQQPSFASASQAAEGALAEAPAGGNDTGATHRDAAASDSAEAAAPAAGKELLASVHLSAEAQEFHPRKAAGGDNNDSANGEDSAGGDLESSGCSGAQQPASEDAAGAAGLEEPPSEVEAGRSQSHQSHSAGSKAELPASPVDFNVNAPEFHPSHGEPSRSASQASGSAADAPAVASAAAAAAEPSDDAAADASAEGGESSAVEDSPVLVDSVSSTGAEAAGDSAKAAEVEEPVLEEDYELPALELTGAGITKEQEETEDEVFVKQHLLDVAKSLRALGVRLLRRIGDG